MLLAASSKEAFLRLFCFILLMLGLPWHARCD
jgi:hypothetical protein